MLLSITLNMGQARNLSTMTEKIKNKSALFERRVQLFMAFLAGLAYFFHKQSSDHSCV